MKEIIIRFSGPICKCLEQEWNWYIDSVPVLSMGFECKKCKVKLIIPTNEIRANFKFDKPYPGKPEEEQPKKKSTSHTTFDGKSDGRGTVPPALDS